MINSAKLKAALAKLAETLPQEEEDEESPSLWRDALEGAAGGVV